MSYNHHTITCYVRTVVLVLASLLLASCQKEEQGMLLIAEGFGGTKAAVDGLYSYWVNGETVRINGVDKRVSYDSQAAYVTGVEAADVYRALYPETLNDAAPLNSDNVSVVIPCSYTYMESDGLQHIGVPMVARGTSASRLEFKHLTAALTVEIKNTYGFTIEVDSVVVESNLYQLSGTKDITLANSIIVDATSTADEADKRVAVYFNGGTHLQILAGDTRRVQVPVLPVGDENRFTIKVGVHKVDDADVKCVFDKTQGNGQSHYALTRRQMGFAGVRFGGVFTVDTYNKQVIISQGNLQYVPSSGIWSFHTHQYDICEPGPVDSTTRYNADSSNSIDLFGYGTSGYDNMYPYMMSKTNTDYIAPTPSIAMTEYDWGWHNTISNGGNTKHQWYILTSDQWRHLFMYRNPSTSGINDGSPTRYTYATIDNTYKGIVLFPDTYIHPSGITELRDATFNAKSNFNAAISKPEWRKMEAAGAVFLPAAGYRWSSSNRSCCCSIVADCGMYWAGNSSYADNAQRIGFYGTNNMTYSAMDRCYGMSVRVVKDL